MSLDLAGRPDEKRIIHVKRLGQKRRQKNHHRQKSLD